MKTLPFLILIALSAACVPATKVEEVTSGKANKDAPYLWHDNSFPKLVKFSADFSADEKTAMSEMSTAWKTALEDKVTFFDHGSTTLTEKTNTMSDMDDLYDGVMGIYKTVNWPLSLPSTALAVTQIYGRRYNVGDSDEFVDIEHADILVNYDDYDFYSTTRNNALSEFDLKTVILHEMGHFLGLQHKNSVNSVMIPSVSYTTVSREPKTLDKYDIADKYHISTSSSASAAIADVAPVYKKKKAGDQLKMLIELHADGECVHKVDGTVIERHPASIKNYR